MTLLSSVELFYIWNWICFIIDEFYNINTVIFLFINVKLLWNDLWLDLTLLWQTSKALSKNDESLKYIPYFGFQIVPYFI